VASEKRISPATVERPRLTILPVIDRSFPQRSAASQTAMSRVTARLGEVTQQAGMPAMQSAIVARTEGRGGPDSNDRSASERVASPDISMPFSATSKPKGMLPMK